MENKTLEEQKLEWEEMEREQPLNCEKCGEETSNRMVGDESYNFCRECNWVTN